MLTSDISKRRIDLKAARTRLSGPMMNCVTDSVRRREGTVTGFGLPLGGKVQQSGDSFYSVAMPLP